MTSGSILQSILPVLLLLGAVLVLKGLFGRVSTATLPVRAVPLMTPIERRTLAYIEEALPWARIHAQVSMGAIMASAFPANDGYSGNGTASQTSSNGVLKEKAL